MSPRRLDSHVECETVLLQFILWILDELNPLDCNGVKQPHGGDKEVNVLFGHVVNFVRPSRFSTLPFATKQNVILRDQDALTRLVNINININRCVPRTCFQIIHLEGATLVSLS